MTKWIILSNPNMYDAVSAFRTLKQIDWRQNINAEVGDIAFIYVARPVKAIRLKCNVINVDLPSPKIEDSQFNVNGESFDDADRYMRLELVEEYDTEELSFDSLSLHGLKSVQGPTRVTGELEKFIDAVTEGGADMSSSLAYETLKARVELDPDSHDGSYELMRTIVDEYAKLDDLGSCSYIDMDAIYYMAVGTWAINVEQKKKKVNDSCLSEESKSLIYSKIDEVWNNACEEKYENREVGRPSVGMFGTGFRTFSRNAQNEEIQAFIKMCVDISYMDDDGAMFERAAEVLDRGMSGMQAAAASVILHCLKPFTFPIINGREAVSKLYKDLQIEITKAGNLTNYISNSRKIKEYRDTNFSFKNYRIFDLVATNLFEGYWPSLAEYNPGITTDQWIELLRNPEVTTEANMQMLAMMFDYGKPATCTQYAEAYGKTKNFFNAGSTALAKRIANKTNCPLPPGRINENARWWPILYVGRNASEEEKGSYVWKMRDELKNALQQIDLPEIDKDIKMRANKHISLNTILYGPPGTGKTYNTVNYAVAICRPDLDVDNMSHDELLSVFNELKEKGRIAFTTFHQSYGYEEFIEGIKPKMTEGDDNTDLTYDVVPGTFKTFCEKALLPSAQKEADYGLNKNPSVWKVSLGHTYDNPTRSECMENGHIRIGWDDYGEDLPETDDNYSGKAVLNSYYNKMKVGDIILSCYTASTIDAIGVVTGECEWHPEYNEHKRLRKVRWLVKGINEDIVELNGGSTMTLSTVYKMKIPTSAVFDIVKKYENSLDEDNSMEGRENFVFIIDEINRGNISKIFGELITLIEETKRAGAPEAMDARLPYSGEAFSVPDNVYILGTMNTADRSIALMDTALRRRFSFVEMPARPEILSNINAQYVTEGQVTVDVVEMLRTINKRIEVLYDREHTIGHAFFTGLKDDPSCSKLADIFKRSVVPLLQEYFYEDYSKIQLILGDNEKSDDNYKFIRKNEDTKKEVFKGNPDIDMDESERFYVNDVAFDHIESYLEIYE